MNITTSLRSYNAEMNARSAVARFGKSASRYVVSMVVGENRAVEVTGNDLLDMVQITEDARATGDYSSVRIIDRLADGMAVTRADVRRAREQAAA
jgi:hypothetical protein